MGVLYEAGTAYLSRAHGYTPGFVEVRVAHLFSILCVVLCCGFILFSSCFLCCQYLDCPLLISPSVSSNVYLNRFPILLNYMYLYFFKVLVTFAHFRYSLYALFVYYSHAFNFFIFQLFWLSEYLLKGMLETLVNTIFEC